VKNASEDTDPLLLDDGSCRSDDNSATEEQNYVIMMLKQKVDFLETQNKKLLSKVNARHEDVHKLALLLNKEITQRKECENKLVRANEKVSIIEKERDELLMEINSIITPKSSSSSSSLHQEEQDAIRRHAIKMLLLANQVIKRQQIEERTVDFLSTNSSNGYNGHCSDACAEHNFSPTTHTEQKEKENKFTASMSASSLPSPFNREKANVESTASMDCLEATSNVLDERQQCNNKDRTNDNIKASGNEELVNFFLPKLDSQGKGCNCNNAGGTFNQELCHECQTSIFDNNDSSNSNSNNNDNDKDQISLASILRPWQVEFLTSLNITTAQELLSAFEHGASHVVRCMKKWRSKMATTTKIAVNSQSCYVALHIWCRTTRAILQSVQERQGDDGQQEEEGGGGGGGGDDERHEENKRELIKEQQQRNANILNLIENDDGSRSNISSNMMTNIHEPRHNTSELSMVSSECMEYTSDDDEYSQQEEEEEEDVGDEMRHKEKTMELVKEQQQRNANISTLIENDDDSSSSNNMIANIHELQYNTTEMSMVSSECMECTSDDDDGSCSSHSGFSSSWSSQFHSMNANVY